MDQQRTANKSAPTIWEIPDDVWPMIHTILDDQYPAKPTGHRRIICGVGRTESSIACAPAAHGISYRSRRAFVTAGPGIAATALTTVFTFRTLLLTGFKGVAELGFIGGGGILLALLATSCRFPTRRWVYSLCWSLVAAGLSYGLRRQQLGLLA